MMRFLVDNNLPPRFAAALTSHGHDACHLRAVLPVNADDDAIVHLARAEGRVIIAQDTDFGTILALSGATAPSCIIFRMKQKTVEHLVPLLLSHLADVETDLHKGAIVIFEDTRVRIRPLPIG